MTSVNTMINFANKINANLTIMRDGEHLFHTDEQMDFQITGLKRIFNNSWFVGIGKLEIVWEELQ